MNYIKYEDESDYIKGYTYIEIEDGYALRQISKFNNGYVASNRKDKEYDFCLAEGFIDIEDIDGAIKIDKTEFDNIWIKYINQLTKEWEQIKKEYIVGRKIEGIIEVFYPQGVIISINDKVLGIADYEECKDSTVPQNLYPKHKVEGIISGYDEENMWLILEKSHVLT